MLSMYCGDGRSQCGSSQFTVGFNSDSLMVQGGTKICQVKKFPVGEKVELLDEQPKPQISGFNNAVKDEMLWMSVPDFPRV